MARIRADGPMRIDVYITTCLLHPTHGYYTTQNPFGANGDFVTAASHPPPTPTSSWQAGHISTDPHRLVLPPDLPAGNYIIHVALIADQTRAQQNIVGEDGRIIASYISLAEVNVRD